MADLIAEARFPAPKYRTEGFFTKFEDITTADLLAFAAQNDIKGDHIEVTTVKTADCISIELNKVTRDILEKYKDTPFKDNKALPNYTNQAMNRDIKELCRLAGIDEERFLCLEICIVQYVAEEGRIGLVHLQFITAVDAVEEVCYGSAFLAEIVTPRPFHHKGIGIAEQ